MKEYSGFVGLAVMVVVSVGIHLLRSRMLVPSVSEEARLGGAEGEALRDGLARADLSGLATMLAHTGQPRAWDDRGFWLELTRDKLVGLPRARFDAWVQREPTSAAASLLRGLHGIEWAWAARGGGTADGVGASAAELFAERLRLARADLLRAAALDPLDPTPLAYLITCARGLNEAPAVALSHFSNAMARDPESYLSCREIMTYFHPKWHGTAEEVRRLARQISANARPGSDLHAFVILANINIYEHTALFERQQPAAVAMLQTEHLRKELEAAYESSLGSLHHIPRRTTIRLRNYAAFYFHCVSDRGRARRETARIGTTYTQEPWRFIGHGENWEQKAQTGYQIATV